MYDCFFCFLSGISSLSTSCSGQLTTAGDRGRGQITSRAHCRNVSSPVVHTLHRELTLLHLSARWQYTPTSPVSYRENVCMQLEAVWCLDEGFPISEARYSRSYNCGQNRHPKRVPAGVLIRLMIICKCFLVAFVRVSTNELCSAYK